MKELSQCVSACNNADVCESFFESPDAVAFVLSDDTLYLFLEGVVFLKEGIGGILCGIIRRFTDTEEPAYSRDTDSSGRYLLFCKGDGYVFRDP